MPTAVGLIADVAAATDATQKDVKKILEAVTLVAAKELKKNGTFKMPFLANFKLVQKKAREGGIRTCFGKQMEVPARPASPSVKIVATKQFISNVSR